MRLQYEAPSGCPDEQAFYAAIEARTALVRPAREGETARVFRVRVTVDRSGSVGELRAVEEGRDTTGRRVEAPTCDEVVQALALTVALSIDPMASIAPTRPPPAPPASSSAPPPPPPPKRSAPAAATPAPRSFGFELGVEAVIAHPLEPYLHAGGAIVAGVDWPYAGVLTPSIQLGVGQLRNDLLSTPADAALALTTAAITLCPTRFVLSEKFDARLCARGEGGVLAGRGRDVLAPRTTTRSWWSAGISGQGRFALWSNLELALDAGIMVPLVHRQFVIEDPPRTAADTPWWSPFAALGVAFRP